MDWTANRCLENTSGRYCPLKITIAAVMYVIKNKPPEFATSKEYALHLQNAFLANDENHKIFEKEKESLVTDLLSILEVDPTELQLETQPESNDNDVLMNDDVNNDEHSYQDATNVRSHLEFIEALVNITNATNLKNTIPTGKFQLLLSRISQSLAQNCKGSKNKYEEKILFDSTHMNASCYKSRDPVDRFQSLFARFSAISPDIDKECTSQEFNKSQDSGYTSLNPTNQTPKLSYVLSSDVNQALRRNQTDMIMAKSVQKVLHSLTRIIDTEALEEDYWRPGSILQTSVNSIVNLVDCVCKNNEKNNCRDATSAFVKSLIVAITFIGHGNACSLRCTVIQELSASPYICSDSITCVLHQISTMKESICEKINTFGEDYFEKCALDMDEEYSFFNLYKILKELLFVYLRRKNEGVWHQSKNNLKPFNICTLWKGTTVEDDEDLEERKMVSEWKALLEKLNEVFSVHLTHIMFLNCECLSVIEEMSDASGKG